MGQRQVAQEQKRDRGKIFNDALLTAVGRKPREMPQEVKDAMVTEDGEPLEIVQENEVPEMLDPDRKGEHTEASPSSRSWTR